MAHGTHEVSRGRRLYSYYSIRRPVGHLPLCLPLPLPLRVFFCNLRKSLAAATYGSLSKVDY